MTRQEPLTSEWPPQPVIHEVNTWVWLADLAAAAGRPVDLASVPARAWDDIVVPGVDAVWLMGVWERSPRGVAVALAHPGVDADHRAALADFTPADVVGSPYCIRSYTVDPHLGGDEGLAVARRELTRRGAKLVVDYVPNHVAQDHDWVTATPEVFVHGSPEEAQRRPREFVDLAGTVIALGRDPHFEPWQDVCQLNAFAPLLRLLTVQTLLDIAQRADGVRCDMAMLMVNDVFARTWGDRVGAPPEEEFWPTIIDRVRAVHPGFLFAAEVYWDMEDVLLHQGFDSCYDKRFHDRLVDGDIDGLRAHLRADPTHQRLLVRFLENHDEPRAATALPAELLRAAAVAAATLPGTLLLYEGQLEGRTVRPPVALARRPPETPDAALRDFWLQLLALLHATGLRTGQWMLLEVEGWEDNPSSRGLLAWAWSAGQTRHLVVVNLAEHAAQGRVGIPWQDLAGAGVALTDVLGPGSFERDGDALLDDGIFVDLQAGDFHLLAVRPQPDARLSG